MTQAFDTTNLPYDLSSNELVFLIGKKFPGAIHGVDFWCAHQVKRNSTERSSPAIIASWSLQGAQPSATEIAALAVQYAADLIDYREGEARKERLPNLDARQLWLMLQQVGMTKASVMESIDKLEDTEEADILRLELTELPRDGISRFGPAADALKSMLGITEEQFDDLWAWASLIR